MKKHILTLALISMTFWAQASENIRWTSPENYNLRADLFPKGPTAVVVIHGTGGVDQRGSMYAESLNQAGITALVVDFKTGIYNNAHDRNRHRFIPMLRSAVDQLKQKGYTRIGVMGTSLGGVITIHALLESSGIDASAFVALYPNCSMYLPSGPWPTFTQQAVKNKPIMIMWGDQDDFPDRTHCPQLKSATEHWSATYVSYPQARHGWDRDAPTTIVPDPLSPTGLLRLEYNAEAHKDSLARIVAFFRKNL
jgi:dienelactone hydrolase